MAVVNDAITDAQAALGWITDPAVDLEVDPSRVAIGVPPLARSSTWVPV
jgi:hypothetical protein